MGWGKNESYSQPIFLMSYEELRCTGSYESFCTAYKIRPLLLCSSCAQIGFCILLAPCVVGLGEIYFCHKSNSKQKAGAASTLCGCSGFFMLCFATAHFL